MTNKFKKIRYVKKRESFKEWAKDKWDEIKGLNILFSFMVLIVSILMAYGLEEPVNWLGSHLEKIGFIFLALLLVNAICWFGHFISYWVSHKRWWEREGKA